MDVTTLLLSGAVTAAVITNLVTIYTKQTDYKNLYYKSVVDKRVLAYEKLDEIIRMLKRATILGNSGCHLIFTNGEEEFYQSFGKILEAQNHEFWLSEHTKQAFHNIQKELTRCSIMYTSGNSLNTIGIEEYQTIGTLRDKLEISIVNDLPNLHLIKKFLKQKKIETTFQLRDITQRPE